jgi:hypothetical protein
MFFSGFHKQNKIINQLPDLIISNTFYYRDRLYEVPLAH